MPDVVCSNENSCSHPAADLGAASNPGEVRAAWGLEHFNGECLLHLYHHDWRAARIALQYSLHELPAQVGNLRRRLRVADATGVQLEARMLKRTSAAVAASELSAVAEEIEQAAVCGRLELCSELLPSLTGEFERYKLAIKQDGWL